MTRQELIARLEAATGASWELDYVIHCLVWEWEDIGGYWLRHKVTGQTRRANPSEYGPSPAYSASLDAALTLLPPPGLTLYTWKVEGRCDSRRSFYHAEITVPSREWRGTSVTPALALCIAALRAREDAP